MRNTPATGVQDTSAQIVRQVAPVLLPAASAGRSFVKIVMEVLPIATVLSATKKYAVTAFQPRNATLATDSGVNVAATEEMLNNMVSMVSKGFNVQGVVSVPAVSVVQARDAVITQTLTVVVNSAIYISVANVFWLKEMALILMAWTRSVSVAVLESAQVATIWQTLIVIVCTAVTISVTSVLEQRETHTLPFAVPPPSGLKIITAYAVEGPIPNVNVNAARNISVTTVLENM